MSETKYWLWLSMVFGTGSRRIWEIAGLLGSAERAFRTLTTKSGLLNLLPKEEKAAKTLSLEKADDYIVQCENKGIKLVGFDDNDYPNQLRHIFNPPVILYYKGDISCLNGTRTVTAVGTRNASQYGLDAAYRICTQLAQKGIVIVSGFAVGSDLNCHLAAVNDYRPTACVLGCGVDYDYPKENFKYRDMVLENGGVFISEYPPGTAPRPQNFPKRNRILAGLGYITVVFEASVKSGSLITADFALEQGRDVFCLPPADIFNDAYSGNKEFLRNGASVLCDAEDIIYCFSRGSVIDTEIRDSWKMYRKSSKDADETDSEIKKDVIENTIIEAVQSETKTDSIAAENEKDTSLREEMSEIQQKIYDMISGGTKHADAIAAAIDTDSGTVMAELTELELLGAIRSLPGKMFEINN